MHAALKSTHEWRGIVRAGARRRAPPRTAVHSASEAPGEIKVLAMSCPAAAGKGQSKLRWRSSRRASQPGTSVRDAWARRSASRRDRRGRGRAAPLPVCHLVRTRTERHLPSAPGRTHGSVRRSEERSVIVLPSFPYRRLTKCATQPAGLLLRALPGAKHTSGSQGDLQRQGTWRSTPLSRSRTPDARRALAADLVRLKRESHLFDRLFEALVTVDAESLHPFLSELDWKAEPESLAWTRAPFESIKFAEATLSKSAAVQLREQVPIGTVAPARELARRTRAPANDVGAPVLALARSGSPDAITQLTRWLSESRTPAEQVDELLIVAGWQLHDGRPKQLWGHRMALHIQRAPDGRGHLFEPSKSKCPACNSDLLCLLRDSSTQAMPFPLFTCANCVRFDIAPYHVEVSASGVPKATVLQELDEDYEPSIRRDTAPTSVSVAFESAPWEVAFASAPRDDEFEHLTRIGGSPSWVQSPQSAGACPKWAVPMEFLAQFPDPPADIGGEIWYGMLYVFGCTGCRIAASFVQNA